MDFEAILLSKILRENDLTQVLDHRVSDELFVGYPHVWQYLTKTYADHGGMPPLDLVEEKFADFSFQDVPDTPMSFLIGELKKRHVHNLMTESMKKQAKLLKLKDPYAALEEMRSVLVRADTDTRPSYDMNFAEDIEERLTRYAEAELAGGVTGIPTPWPILDEVTQGLQSEDLIMIAGRGKVGKTWAEMVFARKHWEDGYIPLVFSREQAVWQIARRLDALHAQLPYGRFKSGMLTSEEKERWQQSLESMRGARPLWITGDDGDGHLGVTAIRAKIHRYKPHVVYIDGAYLIRDDRKARELWQQFSNVCQDLKRLAQSEKMPIVVTHQFNASGKGKDGSEDTLKFGDVQMWFDVIIGCYRDEGMKQDNEMLMKILKHREGDEASWIANWNFDTMRFDQKPEAAELAEGQIPYEQEEPVKF
jgi:replicative DNA helicase